MENSCEEETLSSKVLEYYRKYSRDKKLATYFCGGVHHHITHHTNDKNFNPFKQGIIPTVSITDVTEEQNSLEAIENTRAANMENVDVQRPPLIGQDKLSIGLGLDDADNDAVRVSSPTSSVTSNRKLEWDNGADIGYDNCHKHKVLQKSLSLPVLTSGEKVDLCKTLLRLSPEGNVTETSTQTNQKYSSSESSDVNVKKFVMQESSSSSEYENPIKVVESTSSSSYVTKLPEVVSTTDSECDSDVKSNVLNFLNKKVGLPVATSTPVYKLRDTVGSIIKVADKGVSSESGCASSNSQNVPVIMRSADVNGTSTTTLITSTSIPVLSTPSTSNTSKLTAHNVDSNMCAVDNRKVLRIHSGSACIQQEDARKLFAQSDSVLVENLENLENFARNGNKKLQMLAVTTPLTVECVNYMIDSANAQDKVIQTTIIASVSVAVQTENNYDEFSSKFDTNYHERQSVIFFQHSDSDKEPNTRSLGTNTSDQDVSNCNSFEYLYGDQFTKNLKGSNSKSDVNQLNKSQVFIDTYSSSSTSVGGNKTSSGVNNLRRTAIKSDLSALTSESEKTPSTNTLSVSSSSSPLGNLIANGQSGDLKSDVSKNIDLIRKLVKSKKYDRVTKQYYIKKIVQTILSSTSNSDTSENATLKNNYTEEELHRHELKGASDENLPCKFEGEQGRRNLQDNLPWVPAPLRQYADRKLEVRTFSAEILPDTIYNENMPATSHSTTSHLKPNSIFTLPNTNCSVRDDLNYPIQYKLQSSSDRSSANDASAYPQRFVLPQEEHFSTATSERDSDSASKARGFKNWKEVKTLSEQRLERQKVRQYDGKSCGDFEPDTRSDGDVLVSFAKKERENQINWIDNEITHLSKLRKLLRKNYGEDTKVDVEILTKPHAEDMGEFRKSTSVYVITTQKTKKSQKLENRQIRFKSVNASSEVVPTNSSPKRETAVRFKNHEEYPGLKRERVQFRSTAASSGGNTYHPSVCDCVHDDGNNFGPCTDETCPKLKSRLRADQTRESSSASPPAITKHLQGERVRGKEEVRSDVNLTDLSLCSELKHARLVSSELYDHGLKPYTCIRRYVFEIPVSYNLHQAEIPLTQREKHGGKVVYERDVQSKHDDASTDASAKRRIPVSDRGDQTEGQSDKGTDVKASLVIYKNIQHVSDLRERHEVGRHRSTRISGSANKDVLTEGSSMPDEWGRQTQTGREDEDYFAENGESTRGGDERTGTTTKQKRTYDGDNDKQSQSTDKSEQARLKSDKEAHKGDQRSVDVQKTELTARGVDTDREKSSRSTRTDQTGDPIKRSAGTSAQRKTETHRSSQSESVRQEQKKTGDSVYSRTTDTGKAKGTIGTKTDDNMKRHVGINAKKGEEYKSSQSERESREQKKVGGGLDSKTTETGEKSQEHRSSQSEREGTRNKKVVGGSGRDGDKAKSAGSKQPGDKEMHGRGPKAQRIEERRGGLSEDEKARQKHSRGKALDEAAEMESSSEMSNIIDLKKNKNVRHESYEEETRYRQEKSAKAGKIRRQREDTSVDSVEETGTSTEESDGALRRDSERQKQKRSVDKRRMETFYSEEGSATEDENYVMEEDERDARVVKMAQKDPRSYTRGDDVRVDLKHDEKVIRKIKGAKGGRGKDQHGYTNAVDNVDLRVDENGRKKINRTKSRGGKDRRSYTDGEDTYENDVDGHLPKTRRGKHQLGYLGEDIADESDVDLRDTGADGKRAHARRRDGRHSYSGEEATRTDDVDVVARNIKKASAKTQEKKYAKIRSDVDDPDENNITPSDVKNETSKQTGKVADRRGKSGQSYSGRGENYVGAEDVLKKARGRKPQRDGQGYLNRSDTDESDVEARSNVRRGKKDRPAYSHRDSESYDEVKVDGRREKDKRGYSDREPVDESSDVEARTEGRREKQRRGYLAGKDSYESGAGEVRVDAEKVRRRVYSSRDDTRGSDVEVRREKHRRVYSDGSDTDGSDIYDRREKDQRGQPSRKRPGESSAGAKARAGADVAANKVEHEVEAVTEKFERNYSAAEVVALTDRDDGEVGEERGASTKSVKRSAEPRRGKEKQSYSNEELVLVEDDKIKHKSKNEQKKTATKGPSSKDHKLTQTTNSLEKVPDKQESQPSSSSSASSSQSETSDSSSESDDRYICPCCKRKKSRASALVSHLQKDIQPLLCRPCQLQNQQNNWALSKPSYGHPGHVCNCYTVLKTETVQQIKRTVDELGDLEREQKYCTCSFGKNRNVKCCRYCDNRRGGKHRKSVAYTLTFEQGDREPEEKEVSRRRSLEEIKVKIPPPPHKKKNKENENRKRKSAKDDSPTRKKHRHRNGNDKKRKKARHLTLQEYLCLNKPYFVESAEQRRKCMIELAYMREERCQKYKQLLALSSGTVPQNKDSNDLKSKRIFTAKEMKQITAQNYKKLPEVQQKLKDNRDKQIKKANRLLADMFNKKLHQNVLKGRHTLPTNTSVITLI